MTLCGFNCSSGWGLEVLVRRGAEQRINTKHSPGGGQIVWAMEQFNWSIWPLEASSGWIHDGKWEIFSFGVSHSNKNFVFSGVTCVSKSAAENFSHAFIPSSCSLHSLNLSARIVLLFILTWRSWCGIEFEAEIKVLIILPSWSCDTMCKCMIFFFWNKNSADHEKKKRVREFFGGVKQGLESMKKKWKKKRGKYVQVISFSGWNRCISWEAYWVETHTMFFPILGSIGWDLVRFSDLNFHFNEIFLPDFLFFLLPLFWYNIHKLILEIVFSCLYLSCESSFLWPKRIFLF